jgi:hypothetical protein
VLRAVHELLQSLGVTEPVLKQWLFSQAGYLIAPGMPGSTDLKKLELPLFNELKYVRVDTF